MEGGSIPCLITEEFFNPPFANREHASLVSIWGGSSTPMCKWGTLFVNGDFAPPVCKWGIPFANEGFFVLG
jgi:hypothetical protein